MIRTAYISGCNKAFSKIASEDKWVLPALGGTALLAAGGVLGAKLKTRSLKNLNSYGGKTGDSRIKRYFYGADEAKPFFSNSIYQTDTKYHGKGPESGIFDHMKREDISDLPGSKDRMKAFYSRERSDLSEKTYKPSHNASVIKNKDGTYTTYHNNTFVAKPGAEDQRHAPLHTETTWDKKPSPAALEDLRLRISRDQLKTKYQD